MKSLFAALISALLLLVGCAHTEPSAVSVTVVGVGASHEEARRSGFRDAIQLAYGSLNLSERRVINDQLFEEDVSFARGVIQSFQELDRRVDIKDQQHHVRMSVTVSPAAVESRILAAQDSSKVNGRELFRQFDIGRQQARSEADRYMAARRLFEYVTRDYATGLFDLKAGEIQTLRNGAHIDLVVDVNYGINAQALENLCVAAKTYHESRTASVPEEYKKSLNLLKIHHAYKCSIEAEIEPEQMQNMVRSLANLGICLALEGSDSQPFKKYFYPPHVSQLVSDQIRYSDSSNVIAPGAYVVENYSVSRSVPGQGYSYHTYPSAIAISKFLWGNEYVQRLAIPPLKDQEMQILSRVTASLSDKETCTGRKDTSISGLELSHENGRVIVTAVTQGRPAEQSGFRAEDQIVAVNGKPTTQMSPQQLEDKLDARADYPLNVLVIRRSEKRRLMLRLGEQ